MADNNDTAEPLRIPNFPDLKVTPDVELLYVSSFRGFETKGSPIEVRSRDNRTIGGYAAVFNKRSVNLGGFRETLDPRVFNKSRADGFPGVICRYNHDDSYLLGTTRAGTCRLNIDDAGLQYEVDVPQCREDVYEMTARGDIAHSSFAFQAYEDDWGYEDGIAQRMVLSARLIDVSPVNSPAYPDASVKMGGLRSLARHLDVPFVDVQQRALKDELRSFFVRTDNAAMPPESAPTAVDAAEAAASEPAEARAETDTDPIAGKFGPSALMEILARRAEDPIGNL